MGGFAIVFVRTGPPRPTPTAAGNPLVSTPLRSPASGIVSHSPEIRLFLSPQKSARLLRPTAIALTLLKVAIFGASIAVIHCMYGLRARAVIDIARKIPPAFVVASSWCMGVAVLIDIAANV